MRLVFLGVAAVALTAVLIIANSASPKPPQVPTGEEVCPENGPCGDEYRFADPDEAREILELSGEVEAGQPLPYLSNPWWVNLIQRHDAIALAAVLLDFWFIYGVEEYWRRLRQRPPSQSGPGTGGA